MTLKKFVQGRIILIAGSMNELKLIFFMYINHDDEVFVQELTSYFLNELPTYIPTSHLVLDGTRVKCLTQRFGYCRLEIHHCGLHFL